MIIASRWVLDRMADYVLREVSTEAEAFTEIRRFLEVNSISSNETVVRMIEQHESCGEIIPAYKEVEVNGACFAIYYGNIPERVKRRLPDLAEAGLRWERNNTVLMDKYGKCEWYTALLRYFNAIQEIQEGKECR